eukprot:226717-Rhodomonas_salina.1
MRPRAVVIYFPRPAVHIDWFVGSGGLHIGVGSFAPAWRCGTVCRLPAEPPSLLPSPGRVSSLTSYWTASGIQKPSLFLPLPPSSAPPGILRSL